MSRGAHGAPHHRRSARAGPWLLHLWARWACLRPDPARDRQPGPACRSKDLAVVGPVDVRPMPAHGMGRRRGPPGQGIPRRTAAAATGAAAAAAAHSSVGSSTSRAAICSSSRCVRVPGRGREGEGKGGRGWYTETSLRELPVPSLLSCRPQRARS